MKLTRQQVAEYCRQFAVCITPPSGVDAIKLLWALCLNECIHEADGSLSCPPRFEPAYFTGRYSHEVHQAELNEKYGQDGAKSYGPLQIMLVNAPGYTPKELLEDAEICFEASAGLLQRMLRAQQPQTLAEIFDMWNSGNWRDQNVPNEYIARGVMHYEEKMPL